MAGMSEDNTMKHSILCYEANGTTLYTVMYDDSRQGMLDLSAENPCETVADLRDFIGELHAEGFITETERDSLLSDCELM